MNSLILRIAVFVGVVFVSCLVKVSFVGAEEKAPNVGLNVAPNDDNYRSSRFFPSWHEAQENIEQQFENELKATLEMLPNVVTAKVHVSFSPDGIWRNAKEQSSASVVILSENPSLIQSDKLKALVAGASSRLSEADVGIFVYQVRSQQAAKHKNVLSETQKKQIVEGWKKYVVAFVLVLMCGALLLIFIGIRRLLQRHGWRSSSRMGTNGERDQSASSGSVK